MKFAREAGVLLHPTSLPGPYGMGEIGPEARRFARKLKEMGQGLWQMLPLGPTGYGDSPYQSLSTFAGNVQMISFDLLVRDGLLSEKKLKDFPGFPSDHVDFGPVLEARTAILQEVCKAFASRASDTRKDAYKKFCERSAFWLDDYALFAAIKEANDLRPWVEWPRELARREPEALDAARKEFRTQIRNAKILQYLFDDQWHRLVKYCHERNIRIVGDIPIFVAHDSADVWARPDLFFLDEDGHPSVMAGVPPDYFSATGQLWGNPLYRWDVHHNNGYRWWKARMRRVFDMVDIVRIDHFRGFEAFWEIPGHETTAINGRWVKGPEYDFFDSVMGELGDLPIIAEDLGVITPPVDALRDRYMFPGMRILQFAFGNDDRAAEFRPESYPENCVVYTGTHDNDTTVGWFRSEPGKGSTRSIEDIANERRQILEYLGTDGSEIHWDLIRLAMRSNANTAVIPLQDIMGLGSEARMNVPGVPGGNWRWRFTWDMFTDEMKGRMAELAASTNRIHDAS